MCRCMCPKHTTHKLAANEWAVSIHNSSTFISQFQTSIELSFTVFFMRTGMLIGCTVIKAKNAVSYSAVYWRNMTVHNIIVTHCRLIGIITLIF